MPTDLYFLSSHSAMADEWCESVLKLLKDEKDDYLRILFDKRPHHR